MYDTAPGPLARLKCSLPRGFSWSEHQRQRAHGTAPEAVAVCPSPQHPQRRCRRTLLLLDVATSRRGGASTQWVRRHSPAPPKRHFPQALPYSTPGSMQTLLLLGVAAAARRGDASTQAYRHSSVPPKATRRRCHQSRSTHQALARRVAVACRGGASSTRACLDYLAAAPPQRRCPHLCPQSRCLTRVLLAAAREWSKFLKSSEPLQ